MIREASIDDYMAIQQICEKDLGYSCDPKLVKIRLTNLDKERECVFVAVQDNIVTGFIHVEKYEILVFAGKVPRKSGSDPYTDGQIF